MHICNERGDTWAEVVKARILDIYGLPAAEAVYHKACSSTFRAKKTASFATDLLECKRGKRGRPQDEEQNAAFLKVTEFLQRNTEEQITFQDLVTKMEEYLRDSRSLAYSQTYMKTCLQKHFGDELVITFVDGKIQMLSHSEKQLKCRHIQKNSSNVVTFRKTAAEKNAFLEMEKKDVDFEPEKFNVIKTDAKLIKSDIKVVEATSETYLQVETEAGQHVDFLLKSL